MIILTLFAFIAGIVTVLSPCVLPVLPIVLSSSVVGGKKRPFGVMVGFISSFTFFTLFLSSIVRATGISADSLRLFSIAVIAGFGLALLLPAFQKLLEKLFSLFSAFAPKQQGEGFFGGLLVGLSLGLLWTPCVGPILAAVISLALTGSVSSTAVIITLAYSLGTAIPMTAIVFGGRGLLQRTPWLLQNTAKIQKAFGIIMIATAIAIYFNFDRQFQTWILNTFPNYGTGLTKLEEFSFIDQELDEFTGNEPNQRSRGEGKAMFEMSDEMGLPILYEAPELQPSGQWFNSEPLTMEKLRGKVVLVDFWTFSCINCIRTLPYLRDWHDTYADKGLVIIGAHAPEFEFERSAENLGKAIADFELEYPIFQDNDFLTWQAYSNRFWPAKYLIDREGNVRYTHFGEGKYMETENNIRKLLDEEPLAEDELSQAEPAPASRRGQTPETYLGYKRAQSYTPENSNLTADEAVDLNYSGELPLNGVGLNGTWFLGPEAIEANQEGAQLDLRFQAKQVHLVLALAEGHQQGKVQVSLDGQTYSGTDQTDTSSTGIVTVTDAQKYTLLDLDSFGEHTLTLTFDEGVEAYAFTFGSE